MRTLVLTVVLLGLAGVGLFWLLAGHSLSPDSPVDRIRIQEAEELTTEAEEDETPPREAATPLEAPSGGRRFPNLRVRVVDTTGTDVPEAEIVLFARRTHRDPMQPAPEPRTVTSLRTDPRGRASFPVTIFPRHWHVLVARKESRGTSAPRNLTPNLLRGDREVRLVLLPDFLLEGTVYGPRGQPLPGVRVECSHSWRYVQPSHAVTDPRGRYRVLLAGGGSYSVRARHGGDAAHLYLSTDPGGHRWMDFHLGLELEVHGRVVTPDDKGAPSAKVEARVVVRPRSHWQRAGQTSGRPASVTTNEAGEYRLRVRRPGTYELVASAKGWAQSRRVQTDLAPSQSSVEVELALRRFASLRGVVLLADGSPAAEASLEAVPDRITLHPGPRRDIYRQTHRGRHVETQADGTFAFDGLLPGERYSIVCDVPSSPVPLCRHGIPAGTLNLVLREGDALQAEAVVRGVVRTTTGPLADRYVVHVLREIEGRWWHGEHFAVRAADGAFDVTGLHAGATYALRVVVGGARGVSYEDLRHSIRSKSFVAKPGEQRIDLFLQRPGQVRVRVVSPGGAPVPSAVGFQRIDGGFALQPIWIDVRWGVPRSDGEVGPVEVAPGRYCVAVRTTDSRLSRPRKIVIREGGRTTVVLEMPER